ncbi:MULTISPECIES: autotransporter outer membrane beta-barrel domain-containing protein [unclassified Gilliamella]|uniref:autotransporter outer membrane beta-barrel domain-containing protein n=1 Tax=unclassified Gilliamella TaxID=2685620 RepID=UPI00130A29DE|nr:MULTISPECIES: autotransporter outer membrane beta-barrel domain-containing protein [unclassified Gilliamella]MWP49054.1 autotransporter outer membrane beta-barrel domain-containing protein [Gilliamella sp. Lep-s35]MWP68881.1 autotransporter outer membrane beta-barrel domain-containing protein [Gilliamella sp. Lep-s5]MWP76895.1 autotransporter outer membrane beta-barrel domain-containing protein [Gilliamella sp. Lep-s21]
MKNKIILGLTLATPLAVNALELQGTQTYTDEINVPVTHDLNKVNGEITSGIHIFANSNTVFEKNVTINIQREDNHIEDGREISGLNSFLSPHSTSSTIFNGDLTIHMQGHNSDAINIFGDSSIVVNGKTTLSVSDRESSDAISVTDGNVTLHGESVIDGNIVAYDAGVIKINNKSIIHGDIEAINNGTIILNLTAGSKIVGHVTGLYNPDEVNLGETTGIIKMNLAKGASWEITDEDSYLTELSGQGSIKFVNDNSNGNYGELTIENLKGESSFDLRTDIAAAKSDKIIISKSADTNRPISAEGTHTLNLTNNGASNTTGKEKLTLVKIDDNATSTAEFKINHDVELGGYQYSLKKDGKDYVLTANPITSSAMASAGFLNSNYLMSYVETQTLLKRLGDMRTSGQFGDVWLRVFSGKLDSFSGGKLSKFDMSYHGFQFGADKQLSEDSPFVVGAFVGQTYGDPNYHKGDGSLKSFNTGLYATYLSNDGFYVDGVAKYARQKNHFKVKDTASNHVQGTGHTNGLGLSLELGQKYKLNDFYIEPQSQLSYSHQNATSINATNGLKVKLGNYNSLIGRASALFGYEINSDNNNINIYARTGIVREFNGDTYYKLNTNKESHSFKGNWWNNGVGISAQLNQQHNIYLDLESSPGNRFDLLQANAGYRFSF